MKDKYYIPPEHEQKMVIANTPVWLREHFRQEAKEEIFDDLDVWLEEEYKTNSLFFEEYDKIKQKNKVER